MFTNTTNFGIEIEFTHNQIQTARYNTGSTNHPVRIEIARKLNEAGINCHNIGYTHRVMSGWKLIYDSSCGFELVSPILTGYTGLNELKTVLRVLRECGAKVSANCGTHVHFDARSLQFRDIRLACERWVMCEDLFDCFQPRSRRANNNQFCQGHRDTIDDVRRAASLPSLTYAVNRGTRYRKLNLEAYARHKTIEIRHHAGTLNYTKISNWIKLQAIVLYGKNEITNDGMRSKFDSLFTAPATTTTRPLGNVATVTASDKLAHIKQLFYSQANLRNTKEIHKWAEDCGIDKFNLKRKDEWIRLYRTYFAMYRPVAREEVTLTSDNAALEMNEIKNFFLSRARGFGRELTAA
ncbi:amidoligase family protein [Roseofilum capinflatum]|uniref:Amidoligase family protein n=1 Tax=Roseofilum capinflatum BLCC-M114 TaxID=3022440 RepID=A0ABT7B6W7_9CYAN|nr:amidoligase family protein [Roseofilum capinflatum]MDJ1174881.1 amidoligase family protein [Roseofilum capinflatum BLCC-M114]